jgi:mevalonate kinase
VLSEGDLITLGKLMKANHQRLVSLGVSIDKLDSLVDAAHQAGALGAKLTGSGYGGNIIALINDDDINKVKKALITAGANRVWHTIVT